MKWLIDLRVWCEPASMSEWHSLDSGCKSLVEKWMPIELQKCVDIEVAPTVATIINLWEEGPVVVGYCADTTIPICPVELTVEKVFVSLLQGSRPVMQCEIIKAPSVSALCHYVKQYALCYGFLLTNGEGVIDGQDYSIAR